MKPKPTRKELDVAPTFAMAATTLIPRKTLLGNPVKTAPQISPDGSHIAYVAPNEQDVLQVWVKPVLDGEARVVTSDRKRGIRIFNWTYQPDTLICQQDADGDENYHVYSVNLTTNVVRDLTPFQGARAQIIGLDRHFPRELLVSLNMPRPQVFDVYRIDLETGAVVLDTSNPGEVVGWETDARFRVRACQAMTPDGGMDIRVRDSEQDDWKSLIKVSPEDADSQVVGFTNDGTGLYLKSSVDRDTLALTLRDLHSDKETVLAVRAGADAQEVMVNPETHAVEAVSFNREKVTWEVLDKQIASDLQFLQAAGKGEAAVDSRDQADTHWIVRFSSDTRAVGFYLYDRPAKKLIHLFDARPELEKYTLSVMKPVVIPSRDGLELVSYLTIPAECSGKNLPTILLVHGGPWARDVWGYNGYHQWLANRGYAVLSVNFRGSTGFGKKFLHAGDREWAGKMHDDLVDATDWLIKEGVADPKKIAIMGGSYGGYAALVGATFTPDLFACAVDIVGPSNLSTLLKSIPPYWEPMKKLFDVRMAPLDDEAYLRARSPLFKVDQIKIPLFIAQGANDPRVKQAESEQIVAAMQQAGKPVEYLLFPDEGHGFVRPENQLKFAAACEAFLATHLGGRCEP